MSVWKSTPWTSSKAQRSCNKSFLWCCTACRSRQRTLFFRQFVFDSAACNYLPSLTVRSPSMTLMSFKKPISCGDVKTFDTNGHILTVHLSIFAPVYSITTYTLTLSLTVESAVMYWRVSCYRGLSQSHEIVLLCLALFWLVCSASDRNTVKSHEIWQLNLKNGGNSLYTSPAVIVSNAEVVTVMSMRSDGATH